MREFDTHRSEQTHRENGTVPIAGIALDMDGLLFDTEGLYWQVGETVLVRRGHRFCAELQQRMMGRIGLDSIQQMIDFCSLSDSPQTLLDESEELYGELLREGLQPMDGLSEWIGFLEQAGLPFGLATSSRRKFVDLIFENISWRNSLSFELTGDDVVNGKPNPEMYLRAAESLQIESKNLLVLEDSENGCAAAVAAGAQTVAVPSEHTRGQSFEGAILVATSLRDPRLWDLVRG